MSAVDYRTVDADPLPLDDATDLLDDYPNMPDCHRRGDYHPAVRVWPESHHVTYEPLWKWDL
jgi:hypothetical protein